MADPTEVRQRKGQQATERSTETTPLVTDESSPPKDAKTPTTRKRAATPSAKVDKEDAYSPYLDIARVLTFLLLASCALSYLVSNGDAWFWGMKNPPKYLQLRWWTNHFTGPLHLTPDELSQYDGTDATKPIYLAINHTIYDVTAGRRIYGPGGSYHHFAGVDASRGYVTGCFGEDRTADMRGVEEMYLPLDDAAVDRQWPAGELAKIRVEERKAAKQKVHAALKHWVDFFANSKKYHFVGYVKREEGWLKKEKRRPLCAQAAKSRTPRKPPGDG